MLVKSLVDNALHTDVFLWVLGLKEVFLECVFVAEVLEGGRVYLICLFGVFWFGMGFLGLVWFFVWFSGS